MPFMCQNPGISFIGAGGAFQLDIQITTKRNYMSLNFHSSLRTLYIFIQLYTCQWNKGTCLIGAIWGCLMFICKDLIMIKWGPQRHFTSLHLSDWVKFMCNDWIKPLWDIA